MWDIRQGQVARSISGAYALSLQAFSLVTCGGVVRGAIENHQRSDDDEARVASSLQDRTCAATQWM